MSHLLPLSALHAAAPGVLDVVFGPDGTFEGAPAFSPPLWTGIWSDRLEDPICQWGWCWGEVYMSEDGLALFDDHRQVEDAYLDCRVPSVAARLAGLCAMAIPHVPDSAAGVRIKHRRASDIWSLIWVDSGGFTKEAAWNGDGTRTHPYDPDLTGAPFHDSAAFLASLTLALAPKIAALGGARG